MFSSQLTKRSAKNMNSSLLVILFCLKILARSKLFNYLAFLFYFITFYLLLLHYLASPTSRLLVILVSHQSLAEMTSHCPLISFGYICSAEALVLSFLCIHDIAVYCDIAVY